jgi:hypothetical protein
LGASAEAWKQLVRDLATDYGVDVQEWKASSAKYGWSLKLRKKKRTIVHLSPGRECFLAGLVLGDQAVKTARESKLAKGVVKMIDKAPRYPEGTGLRIVVKGLKDLGAIRKLVEVKLAN